ncbi:hypothetical protein [Arthrobacter sp. JCM 19049]|uniref:hypothetical protein n=1 Tax=Arthrobacter sp. JCM 19049 TaxID=1460643 RepID=UPI00243650BA|nr:hypothetical protein [Arthrobacter sp. JCM 19049]
MVAIALGVFVLKERLSSLQWVAIGFAVAAVVVLTAGLGRVPWISLGLAFSFGLYGLVKNQVGKKGTALATLSVETIALTPVALVFIGVLTYQAPRRCSPTASQGSGCWPPAGSLPRCR